MEHVTLQDIAQKVGVSERLVAYALSGKGRVGEQTRRRIIDEARALGYRPNRAARALVTGRSNLIALCLPPGATSYCDRITRLVLAKTRQSPYDLIVTRMAQSIETKQVVIIPPGLGQMDGVLIVEPPRELTEDDLQGHGRSVVVGVWPGAPPMSDVVRVNLRDAARDAMQMLASRQPKRPAFLAGHAGMAQPGEARVDAYNERLSAIGLSPTVLAVEPGSDLIAASEARLLAHAAQHECPDALMCSNDEVAIGAMRAIRKLGLSIPRDVAVIGCDNIDMAEDLNPALTTIAQPYDRMVDLAWDFLMQRIEDPNSPQRQVEIEAHLVVRESS